MSYLAREFFTKSPAMVFPVFALVLFFAAFCLSILRVVLQKRGDVAELAQIPFSDEEKTK